MDQKRLMLIKTVKKLVLAKNIYKIFNWICPLLLLADFVLFFILNNSINISIYISLLLIAAILAIVNLILHYQIKHYEVVQECLEQIIMTEKK